MLAEGYSLPGAQCFLLFEQALSPLPPPPRLACACTAGEYIAVEKIEGVLLRSPLVEQVWVHGSPSECFLVAVMVPARDKLEVSEGAGGWWGQRVGRVKHARLEARRVMRCVPYM